MYLPQIFKNFSEKFPEINEKYAQLGSAVRNAGPLDKKTQNLIKLGIAIGANAKGAVRSHARKALAAGATKEEITHAVLLAITTTGFPNMMAAMAWVEAVLEESGAEG